LPSRQNRSPSIYFGGLFYFAACELACKCGKIKKPVAGETCRLANLNKKSYLSSTLFHAEIIDPVPTEELIS